MTEPTNHLGIHRAVHWTRAQHLLRTHVCEGCELFMATALSHRGCTSSHLPIPWIHTWPAAWTWGTCPGFSSWLSERWVGPGAGCNTLLPSSCFCFQKSPIRLSYIKVQGESAFSTFPFADPPLPYVPYVQLDIRSLQGKRLWLIALGVPTGPSKGPSPHEEPMKLDG